MTTTTTTRTKDNLTAKQEAFCVHYFTSRNGTQSAIKAGYPEKSAYAIAEQNLRKLDIKTRLAELQAAVVPSLDALKENYRKREQALYRIIEHDIELPVSAGHITQAVAEVNKMEHVYEAGGNLRDINVVFVIGRGYQELPQAGKVIEQGSAEAQNE